MRRTPPPITRPSVARRVGKSAPRLTYVVASLVGIFSILGAQLFLSIALSDGAYQILTLERALADRNRDLDIVSEDIGHMQDPQGIATLAVAMGMVQTRDTAYLRVSDGAVIGQPRPAQANSVAIVQIVPGEADVVQDTAVMLATAETESTESEDRALLDIPVEEGPAEVVIGGQAATPLPIKTPTSVQAPKLGGDLPAPTTR